MISKETFEKLRDMSIAICAHSQKEVTMLCNELKKYGTNCRSCELYNENRPIYDVIVCYNKLYLINHSLYDKLLNFPDIWEEESKSEPKQVLPKICYLLGSKDNPIKVNEVFDIVDKKTKEIANVRISPSGNVCYPIPNDKDVLYLQSYKIYDYIVNGNENYEVVRNNHRVKIVFDKNQESVLYLYAKESYRYWFVNHNGKLLVSRSQKGEQGKKVEDFLLPNMSQFTEDNKFDAKKYFEEKSVD